MRKYVLDANCYIDASRDTEAWKALARFTTWSAPRLFLSSVVAAELRAGARSDRDRKQLEDTLLAPFTRRDRVLTPGAASWDILGLTLATLRERKGLDLAQVRRSFALDILLAYSCRASGVVLVSQNARDMARIRSVFSFEYVAPYPEPS